MDPELLSIDRLPLPSLKVYTILSVLAATFSIYYVGTESGTALKELSEKHDSCNKINTVIDNLNINDKFVGSVVPAERDSLVHSVSRDGSDSLPLQAASVSPASVSKGLGMFARYFGNDYWWSDAIKKNVTETDCLNGEQHQQLTWRLLHWASQQPHCVWPLVNLMYCLLILGSHVVQKSVFGNLRSSEEENIKDQFWNLVFYKVVFVFGVVDVQEVEDAVGWCFFVSVIGFLQLARQLCQERHNYLIMVNDMSKSSESKQHRILHLLMFIFATSIFLFAAVILWFKNSSPKEFASDFLDLKEIIPFTKPFDEKSAVVTAGYDFNLGLHSAIFMLSEIGLLILQTLHALTMCVFDQLFFRRKTCNWNPFRVLGDRKQVHNDDEDLYLCVSQDINYRFEIASLMFDLIHHVHMFVCCNLFLSMTSLIVSLQMRLRVKQIHAVLKRRQSFTSLNEHIDRYSDVKHDDNDHAYSDNCAICWETIASQTSKILPCNHTFHKTCLRKWLLVSMHCPTCRLSLLSEKEAQLRRENEPRRIYGPRPAYGIMGLLQTGQTLLDLFGGWDPLPDEYPEGPTVNNNAQGFTDFSSVQEWPAQVVTPTDPVTDQPAQEGPSRPRKN